MTKEELRQRINITRSWTCERAKCSVDYQRYMQHFEKKIEAILVGQDLADVPMDARDPVLLAAEIEALCAVRAVRRWDTSEGLYIPARNRDHRGRYTSVA